MSNDNNKIVPIEFGDNFDFNKLSNVKKLICTPGVLSELVLAVTNPELQNNEDVGDKNNENQANVNVQGGNKDQYADYVNIKSIRANIEKVKNMNPDDFVDNGKFAGLPEEVKVVMLYRIFELKGNNSFDYQKSFAENLLDMNEKYKEYPNEVLSKLLRLKFENQIDSAQADINTNKDFAGENKNLAQAIKDFLDSGQSSNFSGEQKDVMFEYYAFFNTDQNEIDQIKSGDGQNDFRTALQAIRNTQDYKNADDNHKDAIMKGKLKACNIRWDYNAEYITKSFKDLSETEKVAVIPYLNNFYLRQDKKGDIQNAEELTNIFFNRAVENKKFAFKVRLEMVKNFILTGVFFEVPIQSWLKKIVEQINITNASIKNIPEDMVAALVSRAFDIQRDPGYNFSNDFTEINIDHILNGILKEKDKINVFHEEQKKQAGKYQHSINLSRLLGEVCKQHRDFFAGLIVLSTLLLGPCLTIGLMYIFIPNVLFFFMPWVFLFIINNTWIRKVFGEESFCYRCISHLIRLPFYISSIVCTIAAVLVCSPVIIYWGIQCYCEQVRENNDEMAEIEEDNLDLNMRVNEINPDINQDIGRERLVQPLLEDINDNNIVI